ncbi:MAG: FAD binding domain-containing protein [Nitrososphaeria archaeon]
MEQAVFNLSEMEVFQPASLKEALKVLNDNRDAEIIANATDLWPRIMSCEVKPKKLVDISGLRSELSYVKREKGVIRIGALTTISELSEQSFVTEKKYRAFSDAVKLFGSPQIRNRATVGGNVCAASSSEDLIPVLLAYDAKVKLASVDGERIISLDKFVVGKRKLSRRPNEIMTEVLFEELDDEYGSIFYKIGRRNTLIINIVNLAIVGKVHAKKIADIRIAANRVKGKIPERARKTEEFLKGRTLNEETVAEAQRVFGEELSLSDDFRASAEYRKQVLQVLLKRGLNALGV